MLPYQLYHSLMEILLSIKSADLSVKLALGRAPPKEVPGASNMRIHSRMFSSSSPDSMLFTAFCNSLKVVQGGTVVLDAASKNGPFGSNLNLKAPILLSS